MVLSPWIDPIPLTRAWCLWELYCTIITGCKLEIAFSTTDETIFLQEVSHSSLNMMKSKINVERSECFVLDDKEKIFTAIHQHHITFHELNYEIFCCIRKWMIRYLSNLYYNNNNHDTAYRNHFILFKLAIVLQNQGNYKEAELKFRECLTYQIKDFGKIMNVHICKTMNYLGECLMKQSNTIQEAEGLFRQCLEIGMELLDNTDPCMLTIENNLAECLHYQEKYSEAEEKYRQCLMIRKAILGETHPDTLETLNNLALLLFHQGMFEESEKMLQECLQTMNLVMGTRHPFALTTLNNLALVLKRQDKYEEAKEMYRECLVIQKEVLGPRHPDTLITMNNLVGVLNHQGNTDEAKEIYRTYMSIKHEMHRPKRQVKLTTVSNLTAMLSKSKSKQDTPETPET